MADVFRWDGSIMRYVPLPAEASHAIYERNGIQQPGPEPGLKVASYDEDEDGQEHYEAVDNPAHYNAHPAGIECIDVIEYLPFNLGTAIKYLWRQGLKPGEDAMQDLDKAIWYIQREKQRLSKGRSNV